MTVFVIGIVATAINAVLVYLAFKRLPHLMVAEAQRKSIPLWVEVQKILSSSVHHPKGIYKEDDALIDKLENLTITPEETQRLKQLLMARMQDQDVDKMERTKAQALIAVMDIVVIEGERSR